MTISLGFVVAEFNRDLTYQMELLGREHAEFLGATVKETILVPGVFDMPLAIKKRTKKKRKPKNKRNKKKKEHKK